MDRATLYRRADSRSAQLYARATRAMPGGNTRSTLFTPPHPLYARSGRGCRVVDEDGQERIDFINNFTSLILGHAHPAVVEAVLAQVPLGTCFGWPTESEIRLAELVCERVPSIEAVRFTNSGSEAVMAAVKAARAFTGRRKIAKFEGAYHGFYDYVEVSLDPDPAEAGDPRAPRPANYSPGASPGILEDVVVLPFNDLEATVAILEREGNSLAAVVVDAVPSRAGMVPAQPGFLPALREITRRHGTLLISDEVVSFRLSYGGAQPYSGFEADLTVLGKIIGGGFPVGAVGGSAEVMAVFDPSRGRPRLPHYGTFNANPVTMVAGAATLEHLTPESFDHLNGLGESLRTRLNAVFQRTGFDAQVTGAGSLFKIALTSEPMINYRSTLVGQERKVLALELYHGLLSRGVVLAGHLLGAISTPMTENEVDCLVGAVEDWIHEKQGLGRLDGLHAASQ